MNASNIVVPRWQLGRCLAFRQSTREWHVWMHNQELTDKGMTWNILVILLPPRVSANLRSWPATSAPAWGTSSASSQWIQRVLRLVKPMCWTQKSSSPSYFTGWTPVVPCEVNGPQDLSKITHRTVRYFGFTLCWRCWRFWGETWRCPNWVFALQPYCTMVPTPPPSVPEVSTIPLPQTDSIAPGLSLSSQDLLSSKATCRDYVARDGSMLPLCNMLKVSSRRRVSKLSCASSVSSVSSTTHRSTTGHPMGTSSDFFFENNWNAASLTSGPWTGAGHCSIHSACYQQATVQLRANLLMSWDARPFPDSDANLVSNGVSIWHRSTLKWYTLI